ncbi:MAG: SRPBCC family protein [Polyangiales bacterium]
MAIRFEHTIQVPVSTEKVFAVLDDVAQTPKWLARCTGIEKTTRGENAVGTKLRYSYKDGGRSGVMDGEITTRKPGERLTFHYLDGMMDVTVDFRMEKSGAATSLTHAIEITPKTFMAKLFSPLIRRALPKQTITAMETLRGLLAT